MRHIGWRIALIAVLITTMFAVSAGTQAAVITPASSTTIVIPASGTAAQYPSEIVVSDLAGAVTDIHVTLHGISHAFPGDLDILLVGPAGQSVLLLSDAGSGTDISNVTLTFDDSAPSSLARFAPIESGVWRPTNYGTTDSFPSPAPGGTSAASLATFVGTDPNGIWSLYVVDDAYPDGGTIASGWDLTLNVDGESPVTTTTATPPANSAGWNLSHVTVDLNAIDNDGGSGVRQIVYRATGAQAAATTSIAGSTASITVTIPGETTITFHAVDNAGNVEPEQSVTIRLDKTNPSVTAPVTRLLRGSSLGTDSVPGEIRWMAEDFHSGLVTTQLQVNANNGGFKTIQLPSALTTRLTQPLAINSTYRYQSRATDASGRTTTWAAGLEFTPLAYQESDPVIAFVGDAWANESAARYASGATRGATTAGATATLEFTGTSVGWVSTKSSGRGIADVLIDGERVATVNLYSATAQSRRLVFVQDGLDPSIPHTIQIVVLGKKHRSSTSTRVDVDAFVVLQSAPSS